MDSQQPAHRYPALGFGIALRFVNLRPANIEPTPDVFAAVMATGVVSIAARNHHYSKLSDAPKNKKSQRSSVAQASARGHDGSRIDSGAKDEPSRLCKRLLPAFAKVRASVYSSPTTTILLESPSSHRIPSEAKSIGSQGEDKQYRELPTPTISQSGISTRATYESPWKFRRLQTLETRMESCQRNSRLGS
jgi:hypothetical protein